MLPVLLQQQAASLGAGLGAGDALFSVVRTLFALLGVCALSFVVLRLLARQGFGRAASKGRLQMIERMALGPKQRLYLVRADGRVLLLGAGDAGAVTLLAELDAEEAAPGGVQGAGVLGESGHP